jgi:hypothetical protein
VGDGADPDVVLHEPTNAVVVIATAREHGVAVTSWRAVS